MYTDYSVKNNRFVCYIGTVKSKLFVKNIYLKGKIENTISRNWRSSNGLILLLEKQCFNLILCYDVGLSI